MYVRPAVVNNKMNCKQLQTNWFEREGASSPQTRSESAQKPRVAHHYCTEKATTSDVNKLCQ